MVDISDISTYIPRRKERIIKNQQNDNNHNAK